MASVINVDKEILGGTPVFMGTRVPIQAFLDHVRGDYTVEEFLEQFPSVRREQVDQLLWEASAYLRAFTSDPQPT